MSASSANSVSSDDGSNDNYRADVDDMEPLRVAMDNGNNTIALLDNQGRASDFVSLIKQVSENAASAMLGKIDADGISIVKDGHNISLESFISQVSTEGLKKGINVNELCVIGEDGKPENLKKFFESSVAKAVLNSNSLRVRVGTSNITLRDYIKLSVNQSSDIRIGVDRIMVERDDKRITLDQHLNSLEKTLGSLNVGTDQVIHRSKDPGSDKIVEKPLEDYLLDLLNSAGTHNIMERAVYDVLEHAAGHRAIKTAMERIEESKQKPSNKTIKRKIGGGINMLFSPIQKRRKGNAKINDQTIFENMDKKDTLKVTLDDQTLGLGHLKDRRVFQVVSYSTGKQLKGDELKAVKKESDKLIRAFECRAQEWREERVSGIVIPDSVLLCIFFQIHRNAIAICRHSCKFEALGDFRAWFIDQHHDRLTQKTIKDIHDLHKEALNLCTETVKNMGVSISSDDSDSSDDSEEDEDD